MKRIHLNWFPRISGWLKKSTSEVRLPKSDLENYLEALIGSKVQSLAIYRQALTHRSYDNLGQILSNERLEYLGDSVINCAVGHALYELYPEEPEGTLTSIRSYIVSRNHLNAVANKVELDSVLLADSSLDLKNSDVLGNALEALVGAIYLDQGFDFASKFVRKTLIVSKKNLTVLSKKEEDYKTEFIILMQKHKIKYDFAYIDSSYEKGVGVLHRCQLLIGPDGQSIATGIGSSKKIAHQNAAKDALKVLNKQPQIIRELAL